MTGTDSTRNQFISGLREVFAGPEFGLANNEHLLAMVLCLEKAD
ncbi:MAG TPA: hypothetical protein VFD12_06695 [Oligella sp.]|nr:hypothetical protein [Oligella sp.]